MDFKIKTLILLLLLFGIVSTIYIYERNLNPSTLEFKSLTIPQRDFLDLTEPIGEGKFIICDLNKEDDCVLLRKYSLED